MFLCSSITNKFYKTSPAEFHFCDIPIRNSGNTKAKFLDFIENRHHPNMFFNENLASSFRDRYPYRSIQPFIQIDIQMLQQRPCGVKKLSLIMLYLFQDLMNINAMNLFISSFLKLLHSHEFFHVRTELRSNVIRLDPLTHQHLQCCSNYSHNQSEVVVVQLYCFRSSILSRDR